MHQEIGYALHCNKLVIPLVEKGTDPKDLGILQVGNINIIEYDPYNYQQALLKLSTYVKSLKLKKEDQENALIVVGGLLAFLLLLSIGDK